MLNSADSKKHTDLKLFFNYALIKGKNKRSSKMKKISEIQKGLSLKEQLNSTELTELKGGKSRDDKRRQRPGGGTTTTSPSSISVPLFLGEA